MLVSNNICKDCNYFEYKGNALCICSLYNKECDELWGTSFSCSNAKDVIRTYCKEKGLKKSKGCIEKVFKEVFESIDKIEVKGK